MWVCGVCVCVYVCMACFYNQGLGAMEVRTWRQLQHVRHAGVWLMYPYEPAHMSSCVSERVRVCVYACVCVCVCSVCVQHVCVCVCVYVQHACVCVIHSTRHFHTSALFSVEGGMESTYKRLC